MASTIGLDIGSSAVRAVQLSVGRGPTTLERVGQVMLPPDAVRDGEIVDREAVAEAIRTLWSRYGLKGRKVALGVGNQQVVVRQVEVPYLPSDELRQSLEFQAQDHIPIPIEQAVLDYSHLETYETEDGDKVSRILLVAAHREMVDAITDVAERAKLRPVLVDLDAFALVRSVGTSGLLADGEGELIVDCGAEVTDLVVHAGGVAQFVRVLLMGGAEISDALMSSLGVSYEEAEIRKANTGLVDTGGLPADDPATRLVAERANRFIDEVRRSLDYYSAQDGAIDVRRVVLTGGGSLLPNLRERLADVVRVPVEQAHPLSNLKIGKVGLESDQIDEAEPYLAVAVGLALGAAS